MKTIKRWTSFRLFSLGILSLFLMGGSLFGAEELSAKIDLWDAKDAGLTEFEVSDRGINDSGADTGQQKIAGALDTIVLIIKGVVGTLAVFWILWSAIQMITAQGETDQISEGKQGISWGLLALVMMLMMDTVVLDVLYGGRGIDAGGILEDKESIQASIDGGTELIMSALHWGQGVIIILAIAFLMFSGFNMIIALGETEEISKQKEVFKWITVGVIVILVNEVLIQEVIYSYVLGADLKVEYTPDAGRGISEAIGIIRYFLGFLGLIAFVVFLYGGGEMILAFGDEEKVGNGRKVLSGALIGIVIILTSYVLASTFISGQVG